MKFSVYRAGEALPEVGPEALQPLLDQRGVVVFGCLENPGESELRALQAQFGLHDLAIEDASSAHQRPKLEEYGETLFIAVHPARLREGHLESGELHLFVSTHFLILIQHRTAVDYSPVRARFEASEPFKKHGVGFLLYAVLDFLVDDFLRIGDHLQEKLDRLESKIFDNRFDSTEIQTIYALKREVAALHNFVAPVGDICTELSRLHQEIVDSELAPYYRDVQDHVQRTTRLTFMLRDTLSDALQVNLSLVTIRQNEVVKRLAGWGAILTLPTMIFTMYGTNFKYMPLYDWDAGYPVVLALTLLACRELYRKLKQSGWL